MKSQKLSISIYDFAEYTVFLKSAYLDLSSRDQRVSYRYLQRLAGYSIKSNHFWRRMTGDAPMSQQAVQRYGRAFGLSARELQYFSIMVAMNQATTDADRNGYLEQMRQFKEFRERQQRQAQSWLYYAEWYLPALRALAGLTHFKEDPAWIAHAMVPPITENQAREGLKRLLDLGYLVRDRTGRLRQAEPLIGAYGNRTDVNPMHILAVRNYHRKMMELAAQSLETQTQDRRYITGNTMNISCRQAVELRKLIVGFMQNVESLIDNDDDPEVVCRLNIQLFEMSEHVVDNVDAPTAAQEDSK